MNPIKSILNCLDFVGWDYSSHLLIFFNLISIYIFKRNILN